MRDACIPTADSPILTLRLKIHVFAENDGSNPSVTQEDVDLQMQQLNTDFLPWRIQFVHETAFENDSGFKRLKIPFDEGWEEHVEAMMLTYADRPESQLNVYVSHVSSVTLVLGFVTFYPWEISPSDPLFGAWVWAPSWHSKTLQHEIGHALGLYHTFAGVSEVPPCSECYERADGLDGDVTGDFCSDTPAQPMQFFCNPPPGVDGCSSLPWPPEEVRNYMSYACKDEFTPQQAGRMHCWVRERMPGWSVNTLSLSLSAAPEPAVVGSNLVYSITVSNYGAVPVTGVIITNLLAPDVCVISASDMTYVRNGDALTLDFGAVTNGASVAAELTVMPTKPGLLTNSVRLPSGAISTPEHPTTATVVSTVETNPLVSGPILVIEDTRALEGHAGTRDIVFRVCLSPPADQSIALNYETADGTAIAGVDYQARAGQLVFMPGETSLTISVTVIGDTLREPDETFYVNLASVPDVFNAKVQAVGTIVRDDLLVDLVVADLSGPETASTGASFAVTNAVRNQDSEPISALFSVGIYLSDDPIVTTNDLRVGGRRVRGLRANTTDTAIAQVALGPSFPPGTYYLGVVADEADAVNETNESNNASGGQAIQIVIGPDLQMMRVGGPARAGTASTIPVTNTVRNIGTGTPGPFDVGVYLSADANITTADQLLGAYTLVSGMSPGVDRTEVPEVFIPASMPLGNYFIGAIADYLNAAPDKSEANNALAGNAIQIVRGPDLIVLGVKSRNRAPTGTSLFLTNTIHNLGMSGVPYPFPVGIYLSADQIITTNDFQIGSIPVSGIGAETTVTNVWSVFVHQAIPAGTYYLGAIVDPNRVIHEVNDANNTLASHFFEVTIGPDLAVAAVNGPARAGTITTISITNRVRNLANGVCSGVMIGLYLSLDETIGTNDFLLASRITDVTTLGDNVDVTQAVIPADLPLGLYFLGAIVDVLGVVPELNEGNNALQGDALEIVPGPDLVISMSAPATAVPGTEISLQNTVRNQGADDVRSAFEVGFYLSTDEVVTTNDLRLALRTVGGLAAGQSDSQVSTFILDVSLKSGVYYLAAIADHRGQTVETSETNNASLPAAIQVNIGPELVMRDVTGPTQAVTGQEIALGDVIENIGVGPASIFSVVFFLSTDTEITTNDWKLGFRILFSLHAGQTSSGTTSALLTNAIAPGTYYLGAIADNPGFIEEADKSNNVRLGPQIQIAIGPDLELNALSGPTRAGTATSIIVSNTVRNLGTGGTPPFPVHFYLSMDAEITTNDLLLGSRALPNGLAAGAASVENTQLIVPGGLSGIFHLGAIADPGGLIVEASKANNVFVGGMIEIVDGPDLILMQLEAAENTPIGGQLLVSNSVYNAGETDVSASFELAVYLSSDTVITPQDSRIGTRTIPGLIAQQTRVEVTAVTIDPYLRSGNYYLGAIVNPNAVITELNRTNNSREGISLRLDPGADLMVNSVAGPASAFTGQAIFIQDTLSNIGAGQARHFGITFYLSMDDTITTNDWVIGFRNLLGGLGPSQTNFATLTPAFLNTSLAPGNYFLGAVIDPPNVVEETDEGNNARVAHAFELRAGPDLEITALAAPVRAGATSSISVTNTVRNSGSGVTPGFAVHFYLSADTEISQDDLLLGSRSVPNGLSANESSSATTVLSLPVELPAGDYWLAAKADGAEQVGERSESNNVRLHALQILGAPDLVLTGLQGPVSALSGGSMTVSVAARNAGMFGVSANFSIGIYLSPDLPVPSADLKVGQALLSGLEAGESRSLDVTVGLPCVFNGDYHLLAVIDDPPAIPEVNENNNGFTGNLVSVSGGEITAIRRSGSDIVLSFTTLSGQVYRVERTFDPANTGSWTLVPGAEYLPGNGTILEVTDPGAAAFPMAFYRTRLMH